MASSENVIEQKPLVGERMLFFIALAFYATLSLVKMRAFLLEGRFWAEEGAIFFVQISGLPLLERFFFLYYGHLELATNAVIAISTLVPLRLAPLVTTHLSFVLQSIPVALLIAYRGRLGVPAWGILPLLLIVVGLPQAGEVWATSVNLHFHFSLLAAIIAAIEIGPGYPRILFRGLLALSGLSGIPANFLAPVFLGLAIRTGERE